MIGKVFDKNGSSVHLGQLLALSLLLLRGDGRSHEQEKNRHRKTGDQMSNIGITRLHSDLKKSEQNTNTVVKCIAICSASVQQGAMYQLTHFLYAFACESLLGCSMNNRVCHQKCNKS